MLKIPQLSKEKFMKNISPVYHGSRNEPEIVSPLEIMKQAVKQALNECTAGDVQITIELNEEQIYKKADVD